MSDRRLAPSFLPTTAVLEMTYRCNHRCLFCSCPWENPDGSFERGAELTTEEWKATIDRLCAMGVDSLAFTGGEPLLRGDLPELFRYAAAAKSERFETVDGELRSRMAAPDLYLLSNGRLVDDAVLEMCREFDARLSMSLPGLDTFEAHTGHDGADRVLEWFGRAKALGVKTTVGVTVTRLNLGELERTLAAALLAGAEQVLLNRFLPGGRGLANAERLSLSPEQLRQALDIAESVLERAGRFGSLGTEVPKCLVDVAKYRRLQVGTRCAAASRFFVIGPDGYVRVCNHSPVRLEHVRELPKLKENPYWRRFVQRDYLPGECGDCAERFDCDGGCREAAHIVRGAPDALDPLMPAPPPSG